MARSLSDIYAEYDALQAADDNQLQDIEDYSSLSGSSLLNNGQFLRDLNTYYTTRGESFGSTEDMLDDWYSDNRWSDTNTISMLGNINEYSRAGSDKELLTRLARAWTNAPSRGTFMEKALDYGAAAVLDPINVLGGYGAGAKAAKAATLASRAGKSASDVRKAATVAGAKQGAITEGIASGGIEAGFNAAQQGVQKEMGLRDDISGGEVLAAGALGTTLGGALGGAIGGGIGRYGRAANTAAADNTMAATVADPENADFSSLINADWINGNSQLAINTRKRLTDLEAEADAQAKIIENPEAEDIETAKELLREAEQEISNIRQSTAEVTGFEKAVVEKQAKVEKLYNTVYDAEGNVDTAKQQEVSSEINVLNDEITEIRALAAELQAARHLDIPPEPAPKQMSKRQARKKIATEKKNKAKVDAQEGAAKELPKVKAKSSAQASLKPTSALETKAAIEAEGDTPKRKVNSLNKKIFSTDAQEKAVLDRTKEKDAVITEQDILDLINAGKFKLSETGKLAGKPQALVRAIHTEMKKSAGAKPEEFKPATKKDALSSTDTPVAKPEAEAKLSKADKKRLDKMTETNPEGVELRVPKSKEDLDLLVRIGELDITPEELEEFNDYRETELAKAEANKILSDADGNEEEIDWNYLDDETEEKYESIFKEFGLTQEQGEAMISTMVNNKELTVNYEGFLGKGAKKKFRNAAKEAFLDTVYSDEELAALRAKDETELTGAERKKIRDAAVAQENYEGEWGTAVQNARVIYDATVQMVSRASDPDAELARIINAISTDERYGQDVRRIVKQMIDTKIRDGIDPTLPNTQGRKLRSASGKIEEAMKMEKNSGITYRLEPDRKSGAMEWRGKIQAIVKGGYTDDQGRGFISASDVPRISTLSKDKAIAELQLNERAANINSLKKAIDKLEKQKAKNKSGNLKKEGQARLDNLKERLSKEVARPATDEFVTYKPARNARVPDLEGKPTFKEAGLETGYLVIFRTNEGDKFSTFGTLKGLNEALDKLRTTQKEGVQSIERNSAQLTQMTDDILGRDIPLEEKAALIDQLESTTAKPKAKKKSKPTRIPDVPPTNGGNSSADPREMILALIPRNVLGTPSEAAGNVLPRILTDNQLEKGQNVNELLRGASGSGTADIKDFAIGYLPDEARFFKSDRKRIEDVFRPLDENNNLGQRVEIGVDRDGETYVPRKFALSPSEAMATKFTVDDLEFNEAAFLFKILDDVGASGVGNDTKQSARYNEWFDRNKTNNTEYSLPLLSEIMRTYEVAPFTFTSKVTGKEIPAQERLQVLSNLEALRYRLAPNGFEKPTVKLEQARKDLRYITKDISRAEQDAADELLDLVSTNKKAPIFKFNQDKQTYGSYDPRTNEVHVADKEGTITFNLSLAHELGHWAWDNLATSEMKREFWSIMSSKYANDSGTTKARASTALDELSPMIRAGQDDGDLIGHVLKDQTPQELWANQFAMFAIHRKGIDVGETEFFERHKGFMDKMYSLIKKLYAKIRGKDIFDEDLEGLFNQLTQDKQDYVYRHYLNPVEAKSRKGRIIENRYRQVQNNELALKDAINTGSPELVAAEVKELQEVLFSMGITKPQAEPIARRQGEAVRTSGSFKVLGKKLPSKMVQAARKLSSMIDREDMGKSDVSKALAGGQEVRQVIGGNTVENVKVFYEEELKDLLTEVKERLNNQFQDVEYGDMMSYMPTPDFLGLRAVIGMETINRARAFKKTKAKVNSVQKQNAARAARALADLDKDVNENGVFDFNDAGLSHAEATGAELVQTYARAKGTKKFKAAKQALADFTNKNFVPPIDASNRPYSGVETADLAALMTKMLTVDNNKPAYFLALAELATRRGFANYKPNVKPDLPNTKSEMRAVKLPNQENLGIDPDLDMITTEVLKDMSHRKDRKTYVLRTITTRLIEEGLRINSLKEVGDDGVLIEDLRKQLRYVSSMLDSKGDDAASDKVRMGIETLVSVMMRMNRGQNRFTSNPSFEENPFGVMDQIQPSFKMELADAMKNVRRETAQRDNELTDFDGDDISSIPEYVYQMEEIIIPMVMDRLDFGSNQDFLTTGKVALWKEETNLRKEAVRTAGEAYLKQSNDAVAQVDQIIQSLGHVLSGMITSRDANLRFYPLSQFDIGTEYAQKMRGSPAMEYIDGEVPSFLAKDYSDDVMASMPNHKKRAIRNWTKQKNPTPMYVMQTNGGFSAAIGDPSRIRYNMDAILDRVEIDDAENMEYSELRDIFEDSVHNVIGLSEAYEQLKTARKNGTTTPEYLSEMNVYIHGLQKELRETTGYNKQDFVKPVFIRDDDPLFIPDRVNIEKGSDGIRFLDEVSDRLNAVLKNDGSVRLLDFLPRNRIRNEYGSQDTEAVTSVRGIEILNGMYRMVAQAMPHKAQNVERELFRKLKQAGFSTFTVKNPTGEARYYYAEGTSTGRRPNTEYDRTMAFFTGTNELLGTPTREYGSGFSTIAVPIKRGGKISNVENIRQKELDKGRIEGIDFQLYGTQQWQKGNNPLGKRYEPMQGAPIGDGFMYEISDDYMSAVGRGVNSTIVLNSDRVKKINDPMFDNMNLPSPKSFMAADAPSVSYVEALQKDGGADAWKARLRAARRLEDNGIPSAALNTIVKMGKGQKITDDDVVKLNKVGSIMTMRTNSGIMRTAGMNFLAKFAEPEDGSGGHFERVNAKMGRFLVPLTRKLHRLPDKNGRTASMIERYVQQGPVQMADATQKFVGGAMGFKPQTRINQPNSHRRITDALRENDLVSKLRPKEREVFNDVKSYFEQAHSRLTEAGVQIGDIRENYFPQIWRRDLMEADEEGFKRSLSQYFMAEHLDREGVALAPKKALAKANSVFTKLVAEDGVLTGDPMQVYSRKTADNADFQRLLRLDKYTDFVNPKSPHNLSKFLENDLLIVMTKYADNVEHRLDMISEYGVGGHGFHDYLATVSGKADAVSRLLRSNKVLKRNYQTFYNGQLDPDKDLDDDGLIGVFKSDHFKAPIQKTGIDGKIIADQRAQQLLGMARSGSTSKEIRDEIMKSLDLTKDSSQNAKMMKKNFGYRADAIANALVDTKGFTELPSVENLRHAQGSFDAMQRQPINGGGRLYDGKVTSKWLRAINGVTLLSFTTLTSLGDLVLPLVNSGDFKSSMKGIANMVSGTPEYKEMVRGIGAAVENIVHQRMTTAFGVDATQFSSGFFNMSLLTPWTDTMRDMAAATGFEHFKAQQKIAQNYPTERKGRIAKQILADYGLSDFADPKSKMIENVMKSNSTGQTDEMYDRVASSVIKFTNQAIFTPNPNDLHLWGQTPIGAIFYQLKSFPMMMARLGGRNIRKAKDGNWKPLVYMATVMPAFGAGSASVKDVVQGRGGEDNDEHKIRDRKLTASYPSMERQMEKLSNSLGMDADKLLGIYHDGIMLSGGLGFIGETLIDIAHNADNGAYGQIRALSTIAGPSPSLGFRGVRVLGGIQDRFTDIVLNGESTNYKERDMFEAAFGLVPFAGQMPSIKEPLKNAVVGPSSRKSGGSSGFGLNLDLDL